ncbi:DUF1934 domain-containing protein [Bombilactobacillus thymidiniphilus]|uniref:DUF1934 domain-containing protein n=1 Tax=Bombilactobacillus thymidiniphilus TaxID=2923363 RepID=A0ABY4PE84_9LACO|nr:DUF1934 domain-containing protein [Bombilactobacillus thymidiniphilus]UQS84041.1 DUF1934 domain-containing protein [Bombilactobacillus thymidiniphilus]
MERNAQNVQVHLKTQVVQDGEINNYHVDQAGEVVRLGDKLYIRYQEAPAEQENENVKVIVKIDSDNQISIKRKVGNNLTTNMVFNQLAEQNFDYQTAFGALKLVSRTKKLNVLVAKAPFSGQIDLDYSLHSGDNLIGDYKLQLIFS